MPARRDNTNRWPGSPSRARWKGGDRFISLTALSALMPRILVTGGAGFIGSNVVDRFLDAGYDATVVDDLSTGKQSNLPRGVAFHRVDIASPALGEIIGIGRFDVIAHLAAQIDVRRSVRSPMLDAQVNVLGTLNVLEAARSLPPGSRPRIVFASTGGALYGQASRFPTSESASTNPDSPYGVAKLSAEYYLGYYARAWGLDTVVLRFGNVYGPRQDLHGEAGVIAIFTRLLLEEKPLMVFGTGQQTRDYIFVTDVADAFFAAATQPPGLAGSIDARAFNVGTGVETSVLDVATRLTAIVGRPEMIRFADARVGDIERSLLDPAKAKRILGWESTVSLEEGLARTVAWASSVRR